ncbi:ATP-binding protein [Streptomyces sp. NPDC015492]|uniref:ATP-binding protein n=1 Tax=Streptomyces sp. NPDC015492 TaxID=3364958 RepID=UPI0036FE0AC9
MLTARDAFTDFGEMRAGSAEASTDPPARSGEFPAPRPPADDKSWSLDHSPEAARAARSITAEALHEWGIPEEAEQITLLVVSELVTNAVEHARAPIVLHLYREHSAGQLWIGVTDGGPAEHRGTWTTSCAPDEHGRGLMLVETLTDSHGRHTHSTSAATTHWAFLAAAR